MRIIAAMGLMALAGTAQAAFFSFASDNNNHTNWTFRGSGGSLTDAGPQPNATVLYIDDDNGALPSLAIDTTFRAEMQLAWIASTPIGSGLFVHNYRLLQRDQGVPAFGFYDAAGAPILTADISGMGNVLTAVGFENSWFSTATMQGSDNSETRVTYTWHGDDNPAYGLFRGESIDHDDFAFTLTMLNVDLSIGVALNPNTKLPAPGDDRFWTSEGSFSGSAHFIPTPGALALLGIAGLVTTRRRR